MTTWDPDFSDEVGMVYLSLFVPALPCVPHFCSRSRGAQLGKARPSPVLPFSIGFIDSGPYFVTFPNLREALTNHVPIQTKARSCTILPNFVG